MTEETWISPFLESLRELSDASAQGRAWIDGDVAEFPAPAELLCQVFDDSGLDDALAGGPVFSSEADDVVSQKWIERNMSKARWLPMGVESLYRRDLNA